MATPTTPSPTTYTRNRQDHLDRLNQAAIRNSVPITAFAREVQARIAQGDDLGAPFPTITIGEMKGLLDARQQLIDASQTLVAMHQVDITTIGERMIDAANRHGFCETYDTEVAELNETLSIQLPLRMYEFEFEMTVTLVINGTATARSEDEAGRYLKCMDIDENDIESSLSAIELPETAMVDYDQTVRVRIK